MNSTPNSPLKEFTMQTYFGYAPGIHGEHGVASLETDAHGRHRCTAMDTIPTADAALTWLIERIGVAAPRGGLGVSTPTEWCLGPYGLRVADAFIRADCDDDVDGPGWMEGYTLLSGIGVLFKIRERWPDLLFSETHPDHLYNAMTHETYDFERRGVHMSRWLMRRVDTYGLRDLSWSRPQWDALFSAWVCAEGVKSAWQDLHNLDWFPSQGTVVRPIGKTKCLWPTGEDRNGHRV